MRNSKKNSSIELIGENNFLITFLFRFRSFMYFMKKKVDNLMFALTLL
jgi:hypothetical protein